MCKYKVRTIFNEVIELMSMFCIVLSNYAWVHIQLQRRENMEAIITGTWSSETLFALKHFCIMDRT